MKLQSHKLLKLLPKSTNTEYDSLKQHIKSNGQQNPIIVSNGAIIIDGRDRYTELV